MNKSCENSLSVPAADETRPRTHIVDHGSSESQREPSGGRRDGRGQHGNERGHSNDKGGDHVEASGQPPVYYDIVRTQP